MKYRACIWVEIEATTARQAAERLREVTKAIDADKEQSHVRTDFPIPEPRRS